MRKFLTLLFLLLAVQVQAATYYISPSGDDICNNGTTPQTPWKTTSKVSQVTFQPGDSILFQGGQTFTGRISFQTADSGTALAPVTVSSYGAGVATISSGTFSCISMTNVSGFLITGLTCVGTSSPTGTSGINIFSDVDSGNSDITIGPDVDVSGYGGRGISIGGWENNTAHVPGAGYRNVRIDGGSTNSVVLHGNKQDGVLVYARFPYVNTNIYVGHTVAHDNTGYAGSGNAAGSGIVVSGSDGVTMEFNETYNNGTLNNNTGGGPVGLWVYDTTNCTIQNNNSHDNHSAAKDGGGFDLDQNVSNCIVQNNTSADNDGAGYLFAQSPTTLLWTNNQLLNNTSTDDAQLRQSGIHFFGNVRNLIASGNTITKTSGSSPRAAVGSDTMAASGLCIDTVTLTTNTFNATGPDLINFTAPLLACSNALRFNGNTYVASPFAIVWGAATYTSCVAWHNATGQENCTAANPPPVVTSATPNAGTQGDTMNVVIGGSAFISGATCSFDTGITVNSCTFNSATQMTASITIASDAATGAYPVTVTNPDAQFSTLASGFTVTAAPLPPPAPTSATPNSGAQGATNLNVVIAGSAFQSGATASFGASITVNSTTFDSATQLTANIDIAGGAAVGGRTITITNPDMQVGTLVNGFSVTGAPAPAPTVTSTSPNSGGQGATLNTTITGTGFQSGATCSFGSGITVNSCTFNSATSLTANISIAGGASLGARTVQVTNPDAQSGSASAFTVTAAPNPAPTVTSTTPNSGNQGATIASDVIAGTGFIAGLTCNYGAGITVNSCTRNSATQATANITIAAGAASGGRTVTVTNTDGQSGTLANGFTVIAPAPAPTVTSVNPATGAQGATLTSVVITGTGFQSGATSSFGAGITVNSTAFNSTTQLTASIVIAGGATVGNRTVTVTNPDTQNGSLVAGFAVTAAPPPPAPTVTSISPVTGVSGTQVTVTITGANYVATPTCNFGVGTTTSCAFNSSTSLTAVVTIASGATAGTRTVTVTNPDGQSGTKANAFTVTNPSFSATVTWTDNASDETTQEIERSDDGAAYVLLSSAISPNITTYTDNAPPTTVQFCYRLRAKNSNNPVGSQYSAYSAVTANSCAGPLVQTPATMETGANEGSGTTAADSSGNGFNGNWNGAWIAHSGYGSSLNFTGGTIASQRMRIANLTASATKRTWAMWVYRVGAGGGTRGRIFSKTATNVDNEDLYFDGAANVYRFLRAFSGSATAMGWTVPAPSANAWHHVAVAYDSSLPTNDPTIWIDGVVQTVTPDGTRPTGSAVLNSDPYIYGNRGSLDRNWDGRLDEFWIYDRKLTTAEVQTVMNTPIP